VHIAGIAGCISPEYPFNRSLIRNQHSKLMKINYEKLTIFYLLFTATCEDFGAGGEAEKREGFD